MKILNKAVTEGAPKGPISWSWIYRIVKDPQSRHKGRGRLQAREATAHGSIIHITALINPSCQPERLAGISAREALQFTLCYCISGFLVASLAAETGCPSCTWRGQQPVPLTLEPRPAKQGAAASIPKAPLASFLVALKSEDGDFASCQNCPPSCR